METVTEHQQELIDAFGFSMNDLEANQAGALSHRQLKRLEAERRTNLLGILLSISILLAAPIVSLAIGLPAFCALAVIVAGVAGLWVVVCFRLYHQSQDDLRNQVVTSVEGSIQSIVPQRHSSVEYFHIKNVSLKSAYWQTDELRLNERYRIYYTPRSKRILSVEWLREQ